MSCSCENDPEPEILHFEVRTEQLIVPSTVAWTTSLALRPGSSDCRKKLSGVLIPDAHAKVDLCHFHRMHEVVTQRRVVFWPIIERPTTR